MRRINFAALTGLTIAGAAAARLLVHRLPKRRLDGRVVLVTGGSRGLGLALAEECGRRGARVAICSREPQPLNAAAESLQACGVQVLAIPCDVRDRAQITGTIERVISTFGRIDVLFNNAGTIAVGPAAAMTQVDYEEAMNTHFWAPYFAVEAVLPAFRSQGEGRIVNVTSIGGKVSVPHLLPYCASKFAAVGYSEGLRAELRKENVFVTTVCPGLMRTGSPRNAWFKAQHRKEYAWFNIAGTLPGTSIAASSAARRIVDAALRGEAEIVVSLPAQILAFAHGVFPRLVARISETVVRVLPGPGGIATERARGWESSTPLSGSILTALGKKAERDYNQIP